MGSRRAADQRVIHNHPFCALCGSHLDLTVERVPQAVSHTVLSTVTGTTHDVIAGSKGPRVVCGACHQAWLAERQGQSSAVTGDCR
jgi:ribosomal protein S27AE